MFAGVGVRVGVVFVLCRHGVLRPPSIACGGCVRMVRLLAFGREFTFVRRVLCPLSVVFMSEVLCYENSCFVKIHI